MDELAKFQAARAEHSDADKNSVSVPADELAKFQAARAQHSDVPASQVQSQEPMSGLESFGRHAGAVLGSYGRDLLNTPHNLFDFVSREATPALNEAGLDKPYNPLPQVNQDYDYYKGMGVQAGVPDKLAEGALSFSTPLGAVNKATKAATGVERIAQAGLAGGLSGMSQQNASPNDASIGAASGLIGGAAGEGINAGLQAGANWYSKSALPGLINKAGSLVKGGVGTPEKAVSDLNDAFQSTKEDSNKKWLDLTNHAESIDKKLSTGLPAVPGQGFTSENVGAKPFTDTIDNFIKEKESLTPVQKEKYSEAIDFGNYLKQEKLIPQNFTDLVDLRKNLNQTYKTFMNKRNLTEENRQTKELIGNLKSSLDDIVSNPALDDVVPRSDRELFQDRWDAANQSTRDLKQFELAPNATGTLVKNNKLSAAVKAGEFSEPKLINEYLPKPGQTQTSGLDHLSGLLKSSDNAKGIARDYALRSINSGQDAMKAYWKLSPAQRQSIFHGSREQPYLQAASEMLPDKKTPSLEPKSLNPLMSLGAHGLGAGAGALALHYGGHVPWGESIGLSALGTVGARALANHIARNANPQSALSAFRFSNRPLNNYGALAQPSLSMGLHSIADRENQ